MTFIPVAKNPYPDEMLYSWICHLAVENGLSLLSFARSCIDIEGHKFDWSYADGRWIFPILYDHFYPNGFGSIKELYLRLTTFQFDAAFMTPGQQTQHANNVFRPKSILNAPLSCLINSVKICPECFREDTEKYGKPYFHRSHQLAGVCTCYKHGTKLLQYSCRHGYYFNFNLNSYQDISTSASMESLKAYTVYAQALFNAEINTDIFHVRDSISAKMQALGYSVADHYMSFMKDFQKWEYADLSDISDFFSFYQKTLSRAGYASIDKTEIITLLMFLFPDITELTDTIQNTDPVLSMYVCPICGREYCSTPKAKKDGWDCPYCRASVSDQEMFENLVDTIGHGEYQVLGQIQSLSQKIKLYHKKCGQEIEVKPVKFLFQDQKCSCENFMNFKQAEEEIAAKRGFKLIEFTKKTEPVKIYHETCGQTFQCSLTKFIKSPKCPICDPYYVDTEIYRQRMTDIVGDEYSIIGEYKNSETKVSIRHNLCGRIHSYIPSSFLAGQRCPYCKTKINNTDIAQMLEVYSKGKYVIAEFGSSTYTIQNTETGENILLMPKQILQEIRRPTPSPVLPVDQKGGKCLETPWEKKYHLLIRYKKEFGTVNMPVKTKYCGCLLGKWCSYQRSLFKKGKLAADQISKLEALGFVWSQLDAEWEQNYNLCIRYLKATGKKKISGTAVFEEKHIGAWVAYQKRCCRSGTLSKDRKRKLMKLYPNFFL